MLLSASQKCCANQKATQGQGNPSGFEKHLLRTNLNVIISVTMFPPHPFALLRAGSNPAMHFASLNPMGFTSFNPMGFASLNPMGFTSFNPMGFASLNLP